MRDIGIDATWIVMGLLCYVIFSAYMISTNRQHVVHNPLRGVMLFIAALVLGPISLFLFFMYALVVGSLGELNERFNPTERVSRQHIV